jgi:hypothetical protein
MPIYSKLHLKRGVTYYTAYIYTVPHAYIYIHKHIIYTQPCLSKILHLNLLIRILDRIILPNHHLSLLLRAHMLNPHLPRRLAGKLANKPRIPEFASNAQVLAAAHQRVGFTSLGRRRDAVGVEILLLAARYGYEAVRCCVSDVAIRGREDSNNLPTLNNQSIFSRDDFACDDRFSARCETPSSRPKRLVQYSPVLDLR